MSLLQLIKAKIPFAIATIGEFVALYFWLLLWDLDYRIAAVGVLWFGFLVERVAVLYWVKVNFGGHIGIAADNKPWWKKLIGLLLICLSEITVWVLFVFAYDTLGWPYAFAVLFIGEQIEHSVEIGLLAQSHWTKYVFSKSATTITLLEAGAGMIWLYMVRHGQPQIGGLVLLMGLTIEHVVQGGAIRRKLQRDIDATPIHGDSSSIDDAAPSNIAVAT